jgi:hypothetical protein
VELAQVQVLHDLSEGRNGGSEDLVHVTSLTWSLAGLKGVRPGRLAVGSIGACYQDPNRGQGR